MGKLSNSTSTLVHELSRVTEHSTVHSAIPWKQPVATVGGVGLKKWSVDTLGEHARRRPLVNSGYLPRFLMMNGR